MPPDGFALLLPEAGEISRYLATVDAGLLATAVELSLLATGVLPWQAVASSAAAAVSVSAAMRRAGRLGRRGVVRWQPYT
jgi:membrane protein implicated in regulation of membrane protease activity